VNPKVLVIIIIALLAIVVGIVALFGQTLFDGANQGFLPGGDFSEEILPVEIKLKDISILETTQRASTIQVEFTVINPNQKSMILPFVIYQLYEKDVRVHIGEIGKRLDSMMVGSDYIILLHNTPVDIKDEITIRNRGNTPELWDALSSDTAEWKIKGEATYALSSMVAGGQEEIKFEFP
jgi:hypothetical protein